MERRFYFINIKENVMFLQELIDNNIDINKECNGVTPIYETVKNNFLNMTEMLI